MSSRPDLKMPSSNLNSETLSRIIRLGVVNFRRNRWLTLGATLLMALTLVMISVSLLMSFLLRDTADSIRSKIDLTIYFRDDSVDDGDITSLQNKIQNIPGVTQVNYIDKKEALEIFNRLPINEDIKKPLSETNNPLPRSLQINTNNPDNLQTAVTEITKLDSQGIICDECVSYSKNKDTVNKLVSITRFVQRSGIALSLLFGIIAIFNVFNIIRITIISRSDEIEIMRYVGASNSFVRGPFIVEGIAYGFLGTIFSTLAMVLLAFIASSVFSVSDGSAASALFDVNLFRYVLNHIWLLIGAQLLIGLFLGVVVSVISIRKYLKA